MLKDSAKQNGGTTADGGVGSGVHFWWGEHDDVECVACDAPLLIGDGEDELRGAINPHGLEELVAVVDEWMWVPLVAVGWRALGGRSPEAERIAEADILCRAKLKLRRLANDDADGVNFLSSVGARLRTCDF